MAFAPPQQAHGPVHATGASAQVSGNPRWKGMTWGMLPALGSAMSACTWHFFYNSPDLEFLVALQARGWGGGGGAAGWRWDGGESVWASQGAG